MVKNNLLRQLYETFTWPIIDKWVGTLQAAAVVRSLYLGWELQKYISYDVKYNVLDAGSGKGAPATVIHARRFKNCNFVAIDLYQIIPYKKHRSIPPNINFIQKDLFKYSPENQYDLIICMDVLEHIEDYGKILELFNEWINPEGKLILHVPSTCQKKYFKINYLAHDKSRKQRTGDMHVWDGFSLTKLQKDISKADFKIIEYRYTFSPFTWFFKELFSIGERKSLPGIGIMILPFIYFSAKIESFLDLRRGNGILIVAERSLK